MTQTHYQIEYFSNFYPNQGRLKFSLRFYERPYPLKFTTMPLPFSQVYAKIWVCPLLHTKQSFYSNLKISCKGWIYSNMKFFLSLLLNTHSVDYILDVNLVLWTLSILCSSYDILTHWGSCHNASANLYWNGQLVSSYFQMPRTLPNN